MNRRQFAMASCLALPVALLAWWSTLRKPDRLGAEDIRAIAINDFLARKLQHLTIPEETFWSFITDHLAVIDISKLPLRLSAELTRIFLLSTDFFLNDQDESRILLYIGYYDPYLRGCGNTIARFE